MLRFLRGWVRVSIIGDMPERFLNLCRNRGLALWNLTVGECGYCCCMYWDDYQNCGDLARKAGVSVGCEAEYGLRVYWKRYRYRQAFFAACFLVLSAIWFSSLHLWDIRIENNQYYTDDQILNCLKHHGVTRGILKKRVDCEALEQLLRDQFDRISWSAASVDGTILHINIAENHGSLQAVMADTTPGDLVAEMDGTVESLVIRKGIARVKAGDAVAKGQVLVSGSVPRYNDALEVTDYEFVHADADVLLRTSVPYTDQIEREQAEKVYTREKGAVYHLYAFGRDFSIPAPARLFWNLVDWGEGMLGAGSLENVDTIGSGYQEVSFPEAGISLYGYKEVEKEYKYSYTWMTEEQASGILQKKLDRFLKNLEKNRDVIVENQVRIYYDSVVYRADGQIVLLRPQAGYQSIDYRAYETETQAPEANEQEE